MVRVNLEVEPGKKEKWEREAEEHPTGNLSAFIRASVEREIAGGHSESSSDSEEILKKLGELGDSINEVSSRMDSMETRLSNLETETTTEPEVEELKGDVFDLLPDKEPGSVDWESEKRDIEKEAQADIEGASKRYNAWKGTIEGLSTAIDEPEFVVKNCIERLQESTKLIRTVEYGDETRYYKVV